MIPARTLACTSAASLLLALASCGESSEPAETASAPAPANGETRSPFDVTPQGAISQGVPTPAPDPSTAPAPSGDSFRVSGVTFDIPEGWESRTPSSTMRAAELALPGESGEALMAVFGGIGGTVQQNVDRWAGQFTELTEGPVQDSIEVGGMTIHTAKISGTFMASPMMGGSGQPEVGTTVLAAMINNGPGGPIQLKVTGPSATIESHMDAWDTMLQSARMN